MRVTRFGTARVSFLGEAAASVDLLSVLADDARRDTAFAAASRARAYLRGGAREPLGTDEILAKFHANAAFGGCSRAVAERLEAVCLTLFEAPDRDGLKLFRRQDGDT